MPREINKLSAVKVKSLVSRGRYGDGGGLYLDVGSGGRKRWVFRYRDRRTGKLRDRGLGSATLTSLAEARRRAEEARSPLARGLDPIDEARNRKIVPPTFGEIAQEVVSAREAGWRNPKHVAQWRSTLAQHAKCLTEKPVDIISTDDVLDVLKPIWMDIPETASRLRGRIETVLDAAKAKGLRKGENPARWRGHLDNFLPRQHKFTRGHHAALPYPKVPAFMKRLREQDSVSGRALEFTILTAARSGETRGAKWDEIDLDNGIWTIPSSRMKAGSEHRVPLTRQTTSILVAMRSIYAGGSYVFPGRNAGAPLSDMSLLAVLRRLGERVTVHGFRSSFKDWAFDQTNFPNELSELALSHKIGSAVERAYRRSDAFDKRRQLMQAWEEFCKVDGVL